MDLISQNQTGGLILIDPYFDQDGIEIFAHTRTTNTRFTILTCTQHREKETKRATKKPVEPPHATAIRRACKAAETMLKGIEISVNDLRSDDGGTRALFHDRYIIQTDNDGNGLAGFHLSNSIQGATKQEPLLVTPIPQDILPDVLKYLQELLSKEKKVDSRKTNIVQLYPASHLVDKRKKNISKKPNSNPSIFKDLPTPKLFFAELLGDDSIKKIRIDALYKRLRLRKIIDVEVGSFLFFNVLKNQVNGYAKLLANSDENEFGIRWNILGEFLAISHPDDYGLHGTKLRYNAWDYLQDALSELPKVSGLLLSLFKEFNSYAEPLAYRQRAYGTLRGDHFEDVVEQSFRKLIFFEGNHLGIKYKFMYAFELLVSKFPSEAVNLLSTLVEDVERESWNEGSASVRAKLILISGLVNQFTDFENRHGIDVQQNLLRTNSSSIRAFGGAIIASNIFQPEENGPTTADIISSLKILPDKEYRLVLAAAISETIGKGKTNSFLQRKLYENWEGDSDLVIRTARVLCGRLHGNHSLYVTEKFLIPLTITEPQFQSVPITIWNEILLAKLSLVDDVGKSSSESIKTEFSIVTDAELTNTIVRIVGGLDDQSQSGIIFNWFSALDLLWKTIHQPFAQQIAYNKFYKSATSVYWINLILEALIQANLLKPTTRNQISTYLTDHQIDLDIVNDFISRQRMSIGQLMELRQG